MNPYNEAFRLFGGFLANLAVALISLGVITPMLAGHVVENAPSMWWCGIVAFWVLVFAVLSALQVK